MAAEGLFMNKRLSKLLKLKIIEHLSKKDPYENEEFSYTKHGVCFGAYILMHPNTGFIYVGSTDNLYERKYKHLWHIKNGSHRNYKVREHFNDNPIENVFFFSWPTDSREEAFSLEQQFLDDCVDSSKLLNIALDAKISGKGAFRSEELRQRISKQVLLSTSTPEYRKLKSEQAKKQFSDPEARKKLSDQHKKRFENSIVRNQAREIANKQWSSIEARQLKSEQVKRYAIENGRKVMIDGVVYPYLVEAARQLNINPVTLAHRVKSNALQWVNYQYMEHLNEQR